MAPIKTPLTVTYRKPGTKPPVFVAGSFTEPQWQPEKMRPLRDADGEYTFSREVEVVSGGTYELKFRIGEGNWWVYDEDKPIGMPPSRETSLK